MPTKCLPAVPNLGHLKHQAKDLLRDKRYGTLEACQRIREFHPHFRNADDATIRDAVFALTDAQCAIAREYGFSSWNRLRMYLEKPDADRLTAPRHERIRDPLFRQAVQFLDAGDVDALRAHLAEHPKLVYRRVRFEGGNYFKNPTLLEFIAENPTRRGKLPQNIAQIAKTILEAGAKTDQSSLDETLALVSSSNVARECSVQGALIEVLCDYGADPNAALLDPLLYGEFRAVEALIRRGATVDLKVAAGTGRIAQARASLGTASEEDRQHALALAAQHGHAEIVALLLDAGDDPNRYSPVGGHSHATPLHQAALAGHDDVVRVFVERGAKLDIQDVHHHATPEGWAAYAGHRDIAEYLRRSAQELAQASLIENGDTE